MKELERFGSTREQRKERSGMDHRVLFRVVKGMVEGRGDHRKFMVKGLVGCLR